MSRAHNGFCVSAHAQRFKISNFGGKLEVGCRHKSVQLAMDFKGGRTRKGQNGPQEKNIQVVVRCR